MTLPKPEQGLVIRYSYLWHREAREGREEGVKDRPCAIVAAITRDNGGQQRVAVVPITHREPENPRDAIEIPPKIGQALGLDWARSWIVTSELNTFTWPGPDIRAAASSRFAYGKLPHKLAEQVRQQVFDRSQERVNLVERDEATRRKDAAQAMLEAKRARPPSKDKDIER